MLARPLTLAVAAILAGSGLSCTTAPPDRRLPFTPGPDGTAVTPATPPVEQPNIPSGSQYTIHCAVFRGPDHVRQAKDFKARLEGMAQFRQMRDWWILHGEGQSTLNYGFYGDVSGTDLNPRNQKELDRARAEKHVIDSSVDSASGERIFPYTPITRLDLDRTSGPPEWDLRSAKGAYSLEVAAYMSGNRREAAVETCRRARDMKYEAYYHHGDSISSVCIGAFPENALRISDPKAEGDDRMSPFLVIGPGIGPLPDVPVVGPDGQRLKVVQRKVEIVDLRLRSLMGELKYHAIDDVIHTRRRVTSDGRTWQQADSSFVVRIPRAEDGPSSPVDPRLIPDLYRPATPGGGRLRSIDEKSPPP